MSEEGARANSYALLAAVLRAPPDLSLLNDIATLPKPEANDDCAKTLSALIVAATTDENLADDYHELFIGLGRGKVVPYGSWHITGSMMEKPLVLLRNDLDMLGITRQKNVVEPEDHAAVLCELMALLCAESRPDAFARQKKIFDAHLSKWIEIFFEDVSAQAASDFYRAAGNFGTALMHFEKRYFSMPI
ncbi:molecular chaperone TorD family protein [Candidatus Persebacteraceae bacterium Df01]|jgi:TorA maturation chaperone TorD|uniref:Molecular chaperone TorD family protein n=1 Tax=Candidatus Doriopsillibacter californiensis TaxID=2970740 RepID=A0ABT7QN70_9GAMM|nr:molecular chaperone TorD family protein [Candidatus Persebacteraceae bacterium Df01]